MAPRLALLLAVGLLTGDTTFPAAPGGDPVRVEFTGRWVGHGGTEKEPVEITLSDGRMDLRIRGPRAALLSFPCTLTTDAEGRVFFRGLNLSAEGTYRMEQAGAVRLRLYFSSDAQRSTSPSRYDGLPTVWVLRPVRPER